MIVAVIPAYNAQETIGKVVSLARKYVNRVIVVDDGSSDFTAVEASSNGARVVGNARNRGYGFTIRRGFEVSQDASIVVNFDADLQHDVTEILDVLYPIKNGLADIVIGSRFITNELNIPPYRKFGIQIINLAFNLFSKEKLTDTQSCFRAFNRKTVDSVKCVEDRFGFSTEYLIRARKLGLRIVEVPIGCTYHNLTQDSSMNPILHGLSVLLCTLKWRLRLWI